MTKTKIRVGIIGSRFAASFHYEALRRVYGVDIEVVGVYSPTRENRRAFAEERGLEPFAGVEELVAAAEVVHVCTPPATHEPLGTMVLEAGKSVVIEKPLTGYFGDGREGFDGRTFDRQIGITEAMRSVRALKDAETAARKRALKLAEKGGSGVPGPLRMPQLFYAENWIYAPAIQKEREIIEKSGAQILWIYGVEGHSGSHSPYYGSWSSSGGGSLMGKAVHPLSAALYLKRVEGTVRGEGPIRPATVSGRTHAVTRDPLYEDRGFLRSGYKDVEDYGSLHVVFQDGTWADIVANELILGGVTNRLEVYANNHRANCNISPNNAMETYNPQGSQFEEIYVVEKIGTKEGWAFTSPDEAWFTGYQQEMEAFYKAAASGVPAESGAELGADTIAVVYAGYLSASRRGGEVEVPLA